MFAYSQTNEVVTRCDHTINCLNELLSAFFVRGIGVSAQNMSVPGTTM